MDNFIIKTFSNGQKQRYFKALCSKCQKDRGYVKKQKIIGMCHNCAISERVQPFSPETREKMSKARLGVEPWNKGLGKKKVKQLRVAWNKGIKTTLETRIRLSCTNRNIPIKEFDGFSSDLNTSEREKFLSQGLHIACFERSDYTCDICKIRGVELHAHHLNSWKFFPEQRFDLDNLITLCNSCHTKFHKVVGHGKLAPNTKDQYLQFKVDQATIAKKQLYILTGAPASGKTWVLSNLSNFTCLDSDIIPKKELAPRAHASNRPLLTLTIGISTFIKNNPDFDIRLVVIDEEIETLNQRMLLRGGKITSTIEKRAKRMKALAQKAVFSGTSKEVLDYLKSQ